MPTLPGRLYFLKERPAHSMRIATERARPAVLIDEAGNHAEEQTTPPMAQSLQVVKRAARHETLRLELRCHQSFLSFFFWSSVPGAVPDVRMPSGFTMTEVAGPSLANDIHAMTLDGAGNITVSGRGYIRILHDDNKDGVADRAIDFDVGPRFVAMGLLWEGDTLYATDDGVLLRYRDHNHDEP